MMERPVALVLGGGGALGPAQVGFLRRIEELNIPVDMLVGTSVGALNAAYVAFHPNSGHDCLAEIWQGLSGRRLYRRNLMAGLFGLVRRRLSLADSGFLRLLLQEHLEADDFAAARLPLYITAANLCTGRREVLAEGSLVQALLASTALPGIFPPVKIGDAIYADGGIVASVDIQAAVERGARTIIALDLRPFLTDYCPRNIVEILSRSLQMLGEARAACATEHLNYGNVAVVHIQPGFITRDRSRLADPAALIRSSYELACRVFDSCWDGERLSPGHYHAGTAAHAGVSHTTARSEP